MAKAQTKLSAQICRLAKAYIYIYIYTEGYSESTEPIDAVNFLPLARFEPTTSTTPLALHQTLTLPTTPLRHPQKGCSGSADIDNAWCSTCRILVPFQCMASISFASESLMDPRIQVKLDKYQKCGNIISQTSLLSSYTGYILYDKCQNLVLSYVIFVSRKCSGE